MNLLLTSRLVESLFEALAVEEILLVVQKAGELAKVQSPQDLLALPNGERANVLFEHDLGAG